MCGGVGACDRDLVVEHHQIHAAVGQHSHVSAAAGPHSLDQGEQVCGHSQFAVAHSWAKVITSMFQ